MNVSHRILVISLLAVTLQAARANDETRTWPTRRIEQLRSRYLDSSGQPSALEFLRAHGLASERTSVRLAPRFSVSFSKESKSETELRPKKETKLHNLDFQLVITRSAESANYAAPIWDGRVYEDEGRLIVGGYSSQHNERPVGEIDSRGHFVPRLAQGNAADFPLLQIPAAEIVFNPFEGKLVRIGEAKRQPNATTDHEFLPVRLLDEDGRRLQEVEYSLRRSSEDSTLRLMARHGSNSYELARCDPASSEIIETRTGYQPQLSEGCVQLVNGSTITVTFRGEFSEAITQQGGHLNLRSNAPVMKAGPETKLASRAGIQIDGDFQDWRNVRGLGDPRGDVVSYLHPNPDCDLLEIKVAHDKEYLYLYSRVAGAHGRTGEKGRYYWYAYIDADRDPRTGYPPTRDDNCYFGVAIGDDCEAQFEFVGNKFIKTFFGFTGAGAEEDALKGELKLGPSFYSPRDQAGHRRDRYKVEYVNRKGSRAITHDNTEGTSEDIVTALSPDGSEVEVRVALAGFLKDASGQPLIKHGQSIDLAIGAECASDLYHSNRWGADSTAVIYGYELK